MAQNLTLDPTKRDYVLFRGSPVPTDRLEEACYFALKIPRGNWVYGLPGQGSELYKFQGQKRLPNTEQLFIARAREAIQSQVIETGQATSEALRNIESSRTGTSNKVQVAPAQTQLSAQLNFNPV